MTDQDRTSPPTLPAILGQMAARCRVCGCLWRQHSNGWWQLFDADQKPGQCCDNAPMGEQIENLGPIAEVTKQ